MAFVQGEDKILYIQESSAADNILPIACLSSNVLSESSQFVSTTTRDNAGWETSKPISQVYSVSFSGVSDTVTANKIILGELRTLKRNKTRIVWAIIDFETQQIDYGQGYLSDLNETAANNEYVTFDGEITGYGQPYDTIPTPTITLVDSTFVGGGGNYFVTVTFTSSDDPVNIWGRLYTVIPLNSGVNVYHDGVLQSSISPVQSTIAQKQAAYGTQDSGTTDFTIKFQLDSGWIGPVSNTVSHNIS